MQTLLVVVCFSGLGLAGKIPTRCSGSSLEKCNEVDNEDVLSIEATKEERVDSDNKLIDDWFGELYPTNRKDNDDDRTWRLNRKALVPILIGLAIKALALIPIALSGLVIMGTIAIVVSKASLIISGMMFLRRFFSTDHTSGGFFGLNPLGFPHGSTRASEHQYNNAGHRKSMFMGRPYGRAIEEASRINKVIEDYQEKISNETASS